MTGTLAQTICEEISEIGCCGEFAKLTDERISAINTLCAVLRGFLPVSRIPENAYPDGAWEHFSENFDEIFSMSLTAALCVCEEILDLSACGADVEIDDIRLIAIGEVSSATFNVTRKD